MVKSNNFSDLDDDINDDITVQYEYHNPFYLSIEKSKLMFIKTKILADKFDKICLLCLSDDIEINESNKNRIKLFFQKDTSFEELIGQKNLITLVQGPFTMINIGSIRSGLLEVESKMLQYFNHNNYELKNTELVYLMLDTYEKYVNQFLTINTKKNYFDQYIQQKIFSNYYDLNNKFMNNNLLKLLNNSSEFKYWEDEANCNLSMNNRFIKRIFNIKINDLINNKDELQLVLNKLTNEINADIYPQELTHNDIEPEKGSRTISSYIADNPIGDDKTSYYEITKISDLQIKFEYIEELLIGLSLTEKEKYYLICNLLISKNYCHYILTSPTILSKNKNIFNKYAAIFRYLIGYAWTCFYKEEYINKTKTRQNDRYVFTLEAAHLLPVFPVPTHSYYLNPYVTLFVSDINVGIGGNICGVEQLQGYQQGIVDINEFKRRLNIFISGKADFDILENVDWTNMVITGGVMAAILPTRNSLMALFKSNNLQMPIDDNCLNNFFSEYYNNSDIDMACNHDNIIDFVTHVKNVKNIICKNLNKLGIMDDNDTKIISKKSLAIYICGNILRKKCMNGEIPFSYDYIIKNKNNHTVKFYFYELYLKEKKNSNDNNYKILGDKINDDIFFEFINYCKLKNVILLINENEITEEVDMDDINMLLYLREMNKQIFIKFRETLKYKIVSKHLKHPFEIFRIADKDFFSCVARFHLPCVRSYYNGTTCYLLPTSITAYHTLINIDFKYFVAKNTPINIINKYRMRGYGTILNKNEIKEYIEFLKKEYSISDVKSILGTLKVSHNLFKPKNTMNNNITDNILLLLDHENMYNSNIPKTFLYERTIKNNGIIQPVKRWLIDAIYDLSN